MSSQNHKQKKSQSANRVELVKLKLPCLSENEINQEEMFGGRKRVEEREKIRREKRERVVDVNKGSDRLNAPPDCLTVISLSFTIPLLLRVSAV